MRGIRIFDSWGRRIDCGLRWAIPFGIEEQLVRRYEAIKLTYSRICVGIL